MSDPSGAFAFFAGLGIFIFLCCVGGAIWRVAKVKYPWPPEEANKS